MPEFTGVKAVVVKPAVLALFKFVAALFWSRLADKTISLFGA